VDFSFARRIEIGVDLHNSVQIRWLVVFFRTMHSVEPSRNGKGSAKAQKILQDEAEEIDLWDSEFWIASGGRLLTPARPR
jgi:hypothetical protein